MASMLSHDIGYTLWVQCDRCKTSIMCFGDRTDRRPDAEEINRQTLEQIAQTEGGWHHFAGDDWLCERCATAQKEDLTR